MSLWLSESVKFPFLFGGTFIEASGTPAQDALARRISLPFRRDFH